MLHVEILEKLSRPLQQSQNMIETHPLSDDKATKEPKIHQGNFHAKINSRSYEINILGDIERVSTNRRRQQPNLRIATSVLLLLGLMFIIILAARCRHDLRASSPSVLRHDWVSGVLHQIGI